MTTKKQPNWVYGRRDNARRGAERAIAEGTAPGVDYGIVDREEGGVEVKWRTGTGADTAGATEPATASETAREPVAEPDKEPASEDTKAVRLGQWMIDTNRKEPGYAALAFASGLGEFRVERLTITGKTKTLIRVTFDDESIMGIGDDDPQTSPLVRLVPEGDAAIEGPMTLIDLAIAHPKLSRDMAEIVECVLAGKAIGTFDGNVVPFTPEPKAKPARATRPAAERPADWGKNLWPDGTEVDVKLPRSKSLIPGVVTLRYQPSMWEVAIEGGGRTVVAEKNIFARGETTHPAKATKATKQARVAKAKPGRKPAAPTLAPGEKPVKPVITSAANAGYQKRIDAMFELAEKGDWTGVAAYPNGGVNTYAKISQRYQAQLLAYGESLKSAEPAASAAA